MQTKSLVVGTEYAVVTYGNPDRYTYLADQRLTRARVTKIGPKGIEVAVYATDKARRAAFTYTLRPQQIVTLWTTYTESRDAARARRDAVIVEAQAAEKRLRDLVGPTADDHVACLVDLLSGSEVCADGSHYTSRHNMSAVDVLAIVEAALANAHQPA